MAINIFLGGSVKMLCHINYKERSTILKEGGIVLAIIGTKVLLTLFENHKF